MKLSAKWILNGIMIASGLVALWFSLALVLSTNRGLDLTDEGLYLLAADPPSARAAWGFPFGWHTGPLFRLAGYDIATFRTLGAFLLVMAGGWLGACAVRAVLDQDQAHRWPNVVVASLTGAVASLMFYASLLTTPSYNWLNLMGMLVASAGYIKLSFNSKIGDLTLSIDRWLQCSFVAFGLFVTIPAKPSTAPLVLGMGGLLLLVSAGWKKAVAQSLQVLLCVVGWMLLALAVGVWQLPVLSYFTTPFDGPTFMPEQTVRGAVLEMLLVPWVFLRQVSQLNGCTAAILIAGALISFMAAWMNGPNNRIRTWFFLGGLVVTCYGALEVAKAGSGLCSARTPVFRLGFAPTVTACLCLVIVTSLPALVRVFKRIKQARQSSGKHGLIRHLCISTWILTLPFVYAFGSGLTPYRQASLAVIFCIIAAIVNIASAESKASRRAGLMVILVFTIALTARTISDSYQLPYRQTSIANQTQPIRIGVHKALLHIEPEIANKLTDLLSQAERAGWKAGTPLVGAVWRWASTVPYFLGAEVPDSLLLTIFGYPASPDVARDRIRRLGAFPSRAAWILTSCPESVDLKQSEEIRELFDSFEHVSGQAFPTDYLLVAKSGTLELWRPKETSTP